jgi:hypothetical protein
VSFGAKIPFRFTLRDTFRRGSQDCFVEPTTYFQTFLRMSGRPMIFGTYLELSFPPLDAALHGTTTSLHIPDLDERSHDNTLNESPNRIFDSCSPSLSNSRRASHNGFARLRNCRLIILLTSCLLLQFCISKSVSLLLVRGPHWLMYRKKD